MRIILSYEWNGLQFSVVHRIPVLTHPFPFPRHFADLKPENFLIKNGAYKLCDFGSAVFGHVELKTSKDRADAEEVIEKTTTQMFRAPEMVDLYMAKKLTQATDVWALGCCLYSLAFLKNCFEEGSNLAILSRNYKIPDDNPYGDGDCGALGSDADGRFQSSRRHDGSHSLLIRRLFGQTATAQKGAQVQRKGSRKEG